MVNTEEPKQDTPLKDTVVVDIDGTIADLTHRLKYYSGPEKDLEKFYSLVSEDKPIHNIIRMVESLAKDYKIVFCTGRCERSMQDTITWLRSVLFVNKTFELLMRPEDDRRMDTEVKPEILIHNGLSPKNVLLIIEDRNRMVKEWRSRGFTCIQVVDGNY